MNGAPESEYQVWHERRCSVAVGCPQAMPGLALRGPNENKALDGTVPRAIPPAQKRCQYAEGFLRSRAGKRQRRKGQQRAGWVTAVTASDLDGDMPDRSSTRAARTCVTREAANVRLGQAWRAG